MLAIEQYTRRLLKDFYPIIAANRPPVDPAPEGGERDRYVRGAGGLVTGLSGLAQATGAVWVASIRDGFEELGVGGGGEPMMVATFVTSTKVRSVIWASIVMARLPS